MKKDESELTLLANSSISSLVKDKLNSVFIPLMIADPLLDPPPKPALIGIFFEIKISTFGIVGNLCLIRLYAMVPKFSFSFIEERLVLQEKYFDSFIFILSNKFIS